MQMLKQVRVAKPCPAAWNEMEGDERTRHCSLCKHNVYNISNMTAEEAENFLRNATGRTCIRYYERADGMIMTKDCPRGVAAARRKVAIALTAVFACWSAAGILMGAKPIPRAKFEKLKEDARQQEPLKTILDKIDPQPAPPHVIMGMMPSKGP